MNVSLSQVHGLRHRATQLDRMRCQSIALLVALAIGLIEPAARADLSPVETARRAVVVATVGTRRITGGEFEDRLATVPRFQLELFGDSTAAIRRTFLERVLIEEALIEQYAAAREMHKSAEIALRLRRVASNSLMRRYEQQATPPAAFSGADVQRYYDEHRERFEQPLRIQLWRILVATEVEARDVLAEARKVGTPAKFTELARDKSLDKASSLRGGNLGFLSETGAAQEPTVRVDAGLFLAATKVADGEFVPEPVREGDAYAVIWRRGSTASKKQPLAEVEPMIRQTLYRVALDAFTKSQIDALRTARVSGVDTSRFAALTIDQGDPLFDPQRTSASAKPTTTSRK